MADSSDDESNNYYRKMGSISRSQTNMDDILIVSLKSSDAAGLWVDYFSHYFQQISKQANRKPFKIQYVGMEEIFHPKVQEKEFCEQATDVKLQLVVVCPAFLEFIDKHPEEAGYIGKLLLSDRTLALLLGVVDSDVTEVHKKALPSYFNWQRQCVGQDQDQTFTKEFLSQAMAILSKIWKQQSSVVSQEKSGFSVTPKKIRQGQTSVFILLTYPLQKDDTVKISIERNSELFEIKAVKRRNPYILKISVPENLTDVTAIVNVLVEKNGNIIGSRPIKCESKLRELEQILRSADNPVDFMCQTLGFSPANKDHLDSWLASGFQKNLPPHFNLMSNHQTPFNAVTQLQKHSHEEYPTLLHFAAKFGLEKLAIQLLDCPGAEVAYEIRNVFDVTPLEIAEANGHMQLAGMLRGYMNMNEVTTMYAKLKEMSITNKAPDVDSEGYLSPKNIQDFYKMCPAPRPVVFDTFPTVTTPTSECATPLGYTAMNTPLHHLTSKFDNSTSNLSLDHFNKSQNHDDPHNINKQQPKSQQITNINNTNNNYNLNSAEKHTLDIIEDKVQKELVEIITDFKNNVHSIAQVEQLVDEWKNRNDVQRSFIEKQQQLLEMRMRYEKIQQEMKNTLRKPTPFDRIKKLFSRSKSHDKHATVAGEGNAERNNANRPISSLSTSSSGSSGRMSTISGCSLGDSGTHSDNEERKMMLGTSHNEDEFRNELNKAILSLNYTPVPAPKPVKLCQNVSHFETIEEKPTPLRPTNLPFNDEFYIQFPPSGLPVAGLAESLQEKSQDCSSYQNEYMNVSCSTPKEIPHEYMNFKVPNSR